MQGKRGAERKRLIFDDTLSRKTIRENATRRFLDARIRKCRLGRKAFARKQKIPFTGFDFQLMIAAGCECLRAAFVAGGIAE
jgi:hypothetical protein